MRFSVKFVPPCKFPPSEQNCAKCRCVAEWSDAYAKRVSQQIYQSHAEAAISFASCALKNSLVKFSNPQMKRELVELCEPRYRDRESFQSPTTRYRFAGGIWDNEKFSICKNFIKRLLSIKEFLSSWVTLYNCPANYNRKRGESKDVTHRSLKQCNL